jgi:isoaspartyl peptidase/L-asparaginase-like protein (Ntn-hydrolase superfamily)
MGSMAELKSISRREFLLRTGACTAAGALALSGGAGCSMLASPKADGRFRGGRFKAPIAIATWDHGRNAVEEGYRLLKAGGEPLDAVERGINLVELDPEENSVGVGGLPNEEGVVQLDAAIMEGQTLRCGSVLALETVDRPISVARRVMERTRHVQLVGDGARRFAIAQGFKAGDLLTPKSRADWESWRRSPERRVPGQVEGAAVKSAASDNTHDTIGMVVLDTSGRMAAGCSTSGLAWKMPGRVGDSPIIGAGLYCDRRAGGAAATGIGEEVLRVCGSHLIVEAMRGGEAPQAAVEAALRRIVDNDPANLQRQVAFIALSPRGEVGAGAIQAGFQLSLHSADFSFLLDTWSIV